MAGLRLDYSESNSIKGNSVYSNIALGGYLGDSSYNEVKDNSFYSNTGDGLRIRRSPKNIIKSNEVYMNTGDGIAAYDSSNYNVISGNSVFKNGDGTRWGDGVFLFDSDYNIVKDNILTENLLTGIHMDYTANNNNICNNKAIKNAKAGVAIWSSSYNKVSGNYLYKNERGVYIINAYSIPSAYNMVIENTIYDNTLDAVFIGSGCPDNIVEDNIYL
jgi:parallel beta-helix repeat protein